MAKTSSKVKTVPYRRKISGKTNYKNRLSLLKSGKNRLVVRFSSSNVYAQIVEYKQAGDIVVASSSSFALRKEGWNYGANLSTAYLVGFHLAKLAKDKKVKEAILDVGLQSTKKGTKVYAVLKGVVEGGLTVPHTADVLPSDDRVSGKHIAQFATTLKEDKAKYEKQFSGYIKNKVTPEKIVEDFESFKAKL